MWFMTEDDLNALMENYETTNLLNMINNAPLRLSDKVFELHDYTMQVCNEGNSAFAERMFDLAEELESELYEEIEKQQQLYDQIAKLLELRPESEID
jgi:hypothetical protein